MQGYFDGVKTSKDAIKKNFSGRYKRTVEAYSKFLKLLFNDVKDTVGSKRMLRLCEGTYDLKRKKIENVEFKKGKAKIIKLKQKKRKPKIRVGKKTKEDFSEYNLTNHEAEEHELKQQESEESEFKEDENEERNEMEPGDENFHGEFFDEEYNNIGIMPRLSYDTDKERILITIKNKVRRQSSLFYKIIQKK